MPLAVPNPSEHCFAPVKGWESVPVHFVPPDSIKVVSFVDHPAIASGGLRDDFLIVFSTKKSAIYGRFRGLLSTPPVPSLQPEAISRLLLNRVIRRAGEFLEVFLHNQDRGFWREDMDCHFFYPLNMNGESRYPQQVQAIADMLNSCSLPPDMHGYETEGNQCALVITRRGPDTDTMPVTLLDGVNVDEM
ncbi:hypothetical protein SPI_01456 [Niveomyces insectorum RCEF 264]|uniref:Uncharacterized protein n=1 Tax=Niveomyces insectorum RCEF 264 TaxID=1081102 RepID=A0A162MTV9_9HYPO|nr:hypothetical protein SPI_01456 [Niveomyces insectorum RCEF 264]